MICVILVVTGKAISENNESIIRHLSLLHWTHIFNLSNATEDHRDTKDIDDATRKVKIALGKKKKCNLYLKAKKVWTKWQKKKKIEMGYG